MADYRLDCCGGFPSHNPGCSAIERGREIAARQKAEKAAEAKKWNDFFDGMTEEQLFQYAELCQKELDRVHRFRQRRDKAMDYMRQKHLARKYLDWTRNG